MTLPRAAAFAGAIASHRSDHRQDSRRGAQSFAGHGDARLSHECDRPAADRLAECQAGERVDPRQTGRLGTDDASLESWGPFGRGWVLKRFSMQVIQPQTIPLIACPKAWTPGFDKPLEADVVWLDAKTDADLEKYKGKLKGAIVLADPLRPLNPHFERPGVRMTEADLLTYANSTGRRIRPAVAAAEGDSQHGVLARRQSPPRMRPPRSRRPTAALDQGSTRRASSGNAPARDHRRRGAAAPANRPFPQRRPTSAPLAAAIRSPEGARFLREGRGRARD